MSGPVLHEASARLSPAVRDTAARRHEAPAEPDRELERTSAFDGIVCFGGVDWWYHNRGHYDLQMMRELSKRVPVLYVNSIGMKTPSPREGVLFAQRVLRKLASLRRGLTEPRPRFHVYSPPTLPGAGASSGLVARLLAHQVRGAARRCGIRRPLLWIACPPAASAVDLIPATAVVYQRTDRTELFHAVDRRLIAALDARLKRRADLVVFCARELYDTEGPGCRRAALIDHGVDFERFAAAAQAHERNGAEPPDLAHVARPRVGFVGGIDPHTFDARLFLQVAARLPAVQFVLVGGCSLARDWCRLANVHLLGQRPYEQVAAYMAACDVLIMPWNRNEWIEACNPIKLKEYLAVGKPVVSTPFRELELYRDYVLTAPDAEEFARSITRCLRVGVNAERQRARVRAHGWDVKARSAWQWLEALHEATEAR